MALDIKGSFPVRGIGRLIGTLIQVMPASEGIGVFVAGSMGTGQSYQETFSINLDIVDRAEISTPADMGSGGGAVNSIQFYGKEGEPSNVSGTLEFENTTGSDISFQNLSLYIGLNATGNSAERFIGNVHFSSTQTIQPGKKLVIDEILVHFNAPSFNTGDPSTNAQ